MNHFVTYSSKYNKLILRERIILLIAFLCCLVFIWNWFVINPIRVKTNQLIADVKYLEAVNNDFLNDNSTTNQSYDDDFEILQQKLDAVQKRYKEVNSEALAKGVYNSGDIISIVEDLVQKIESIELKNIEVLPVEFIEIDESQSIDSTQKALALSRVDNRVSNSLVSHNKKAILKHRIHAELKGGYKDVTNYLKQIESLEWQVFIENIQFVVDRHPFADVSIIFYSFSIGEGHYEQ